MASDSDLAEARELGRLVFADLEEGRVAPMLVRLIGLLDRISVQRGSSDAAVSMCGQGLYEAFRKTVALTSNPPPVLGAGGDA